jgi:hypothetical protein
MHAASHTIKERLLAANEDCISIGAKKRGSRLYKRQKKPVFCPTTERLEAFSTIRADFLRCGIGSYARGFPYNIGALVSDALVPFGQARLFQGGCDRSGGVE